MTRPSVSAACVSLLLVATSMGLGQVTVSRAGEIKQQMEQAQQALKENRPDAAAQAYRAILKIDPANVESRANLGVVAMVRGDWAGAAVEFQKALKLQPSQWKVQALLGLCDLHLGHLPEATRLLSGAFPHLEDPKLRLEAGLQLVEVCYQSGELEKADEVVSQLQQIYPQNAAVLYAAYRVHSDLAFQAIDSLAMAAPDSFQLHRALAEHMVNDGHVQEAIAEYQKALKNGPGVAGVHYELGEAFLADSHLEPSLAKAHEQFESALALNPSDARCECKLGKIELWRSNPKTAFEHYMQALKLNPEIVCAKLRLAGLLIEEGKMQEALGYLQSAARSEPNNAEVRHRLAVLYRELGENEEADRELSAFQELEKVQNQLRKALQQAPSANE